MKLCSLDNCNRKFYGKNLCHAHYVRWKRKGDNFDKGIIKDITLDLTARFKDKMSIPDENGCINWLGAKSCGRYGAISIGSRNDGTKKKHNAHRISYEIFVGEIPGNMCVLHKCDNVHCVNPNHLFLGSQNDNMQDMIRKGRDNHPVKTL